ncbi:MAG: hypothetical protein EOO04_14505 [Chitinophagaceae bacterium]|nr:MAG: hypothetical protein EOO04_14505 [Chitinophagaceae bacterium]
MHNSQYIISASCVISNDKVYTNGELMFEGKSEKVSELLTGIYDFIAPDYPKFYKMDNISKLGWLATEILIKDNFKKTDYAPDEVGIVFANSNSSLDTDLRYFQTVSGYPSPSLFVYTLPNIVIGEVCIRHKFQGENAFFVFEKFQADFIQQYTNGLLTNGAVKACICGWVEILANEYKAAVFLVEKRNNGLEFTAANMTRLFNV